LDEMDYHSGDKDANPGSVETEMKWKEDHY